MSELEYLKGKLRGYMNDVADHMASGGCTDFNQYQYSSGMIKAFAIIERDIIDIEEKMNDSQ